MRFPWRAIAAAFLTFGLVAACGDDDDVEEVTEDVTDDAREVAREAWASFRTGVERLIDDAATGDDEAQDELLDQCRDTLQELREAADASADRLQSVCDEIRDADEGTDWTELRREIDEIAAAG